MTLSPRVPDLAALDLLLSIVELGSLGRAAQRHGISQPSASSRVRYMERLVGVPLLERSPRGSTATAAGALVVEWARAVVDAARQLDAGIDSLREQRHSHLRVAASQTVAEYLFPGWVATMRARVPDMTITLRSGNSVEVAAQVAAGLADLGFVESPRIAAGLTGVGVARDELVVVVPPGHPWARQTHVDVGELARTPLICREPDSGTRTWLAESVATVVPDWRPEVIAEFSSTTAIKTAVASGMGPAVLSSLAVVPEIAAGTLAAVPISGIETGRLLRAVWRTGLPPAGPARDLYGIAHGAHDISTDQLG